MRKLCQNWIENSIVINNGCTGGLTKMYLRKRPFANLLQTMDK